MQSKRQPSNSGYHLCTRQDMWRCEQVQSLGNSFGKILASLEVWKTDKTTKIEVEKSNKLLWVFRRWWLEDKPLHKLQYITVSTWRWVAWNTAVAQRNQRLYSMNKEAAAEFTLSGVVNILIPVSVRFVYCSFFQASHLFRNSYLHMSILYMDIINKWILYILITIKMHYNQNKHP